MTLYRPLVFAGAGLALASLPLAVSAETRSFVIDEEHLSITFEAGHLGYASVIGMFREAEGRFKYDEDSGEITSGEVVIHSDSVFTNHDRRDGHLRGDDFLDAGEYPEITFEVTGFEKTGDNTGDLKGDLTLLDQTRPVTVDLTLNKSGEYPFGHEEYTLGFSAHTTIKRSEFGMDYGLDMVSDEIKLRFEFEAYEDSGAF